jgi:hypothetical protein
VRLSFQIPLSQKLIKCGFYTYAPILYFYDTVLSCPGYISGKHTCINRDESSDFLSTEELISVP